MRSAMRLLVGYDGSPHARRAVDAALARLKGKAGNLRVVSVIPETVRNSSLANMMPAGLELPDPLNGTFEDHTRARLDEVLALAKAAGVQADSEVRVGAAVDGILAAAKEFHADEILLGVKSYEGPERDIGPNAAEIARRAKIPVVLVP